MNFALLEPIAMVKVLNVKNVQLEPIQTKVVYHLAPLAQTFVLADLTIQQVVAQKMNVLGVVMLALFTHLAMLGVVATNLHLQLLLNHHHLQVLMQEKQNALVKINQELTSYVVMEKL